MHKYIRIIVECTIVLMLGVVAFFLISMLRKPPAIGEITEKPLRVEAVSLTPEDVPVEITGYGTARSRDIVTIMPEVAGQVTAIHPRLEVGSIIAEGEVLFRIDPRLYESQVAAAKAQVEQIKSGLNLLKIQYESDQGRLKTVERSKELALAEFDRLKGLFENDKVGAQAQVEQAEQAYNKAQDTWAQMVQNIRLYPDRIKEAESSLAVAEAQLAQAELNLDHTVVAAPFDCRVKMVQLEKNQYAAPGSPAVILADDSVLEISVPLDSREARRWLLFDGGDTAASGSAWFDDAKHVDCHIQWTEDQRQIWSGRLERIESFDERTRTLTVAVRVEAAQARPAAEEGLPLVDGMFCEVRIPGRIMKDVFRLPRSAVSFEGAIYISENNRLRTVPVELVHEQAGEAFIRGEVAPGMLAVTTRLVNARENTLLEPVSADSGEESS